MQTQTNTLATSTSVLAATMIQERPYHETIVDTLATVQNADEAKLIGDQIFGTKIPKNHVMVLDAWRDVTERTGYVDPKVDDKLRRLVSENTFSDDTTETNDMSAFGDNDQDTARGDIGLEKDDERKLPLRGAEAAGTSGIDDQHALHGPHMLG